MSDFLFWNVVFAIAWIVWRMFMWLMPRGTTFVVLSTSNSRIHGWIGEVLVNDQKWQVYATGDLWRYAKDGKVLPKEWQEDLRCASSD